MPDIGDRLRFLPNTRACARDRRGAHIPATPTRYEITHAKYEKRAARGSEAGVRKVPKTRKNGQFPDFRAFWSKPLKKGAPTVAPTFNNNCIRNFRLAHETDTIVFAGIQWGVNDHKTTRVFASGRFKRKKRTKTTP